MKVKCGWSNQITAIRKGRHLSVTQTYKINIHEGQMRSIQSNPLTHNGVILYITDEKWSGIFAFR